MSDHVARVVSAQDDSHGEGHDYVAGSPHLRHAVIRSRIEQDLHRLVRSTVARDGACHVLEVGAGHGTFTSMVLAAGGTITVTEVSQASADHLRLLYADQPGVRVVHDTTGEQILESDEPFDGVVCASLLHHVPDYLGFVDRLGGVVDRGGWFYSVQDPTYYPRRARRTRIAHWGAYFVWRLGQGSLRRGLATRWRRLRGTYSDDQPSDVVEYHVVRDGVDELALADLLRTQYDDVEVFTYWSTPSPLLQRLLTRFELPTDFGIVARGRTTS